jgi:hypothetical protein
LRGYFGLSKEDKEHDQIINKASATFESIILGEPIMFIQN